MLPTLCLNMIVKNESKIITRLFDSVLPIIDTYCICDTGSTDNTIEIIKNYFDSKGKKGIIVNEPFKNFSYNRTFALKAAKNLSDYVLLLDADMILQIGPKFKKEDLIKYETYTIYQGNDDVYYHNVRIVKNDGNSEYLGVTHEYLRPPNVYKMHHLHKDELFILDVGDGGSKANKFQRDIDLLEKGIKDEPTNQRYYFYLGNSYHDIGDYEKAIPIYLKRIEMGGWNEEIWYSYYRIGFCYYNLKKYNEAIGYWLEAYNFFPARIENLYEIIKHYRINGKYHNAKVFYDLAKGITKKDPNIDGLLFFHKDIYTYKIDYEYTLIAAYLGTKNICNEVVHILNNTNNKLLAANLLSNYKFYDNNIIINKEINFTNKLLYNIFGDYIVFNSSSACLMPNTDGYLLNVRYVNYNMDEKGNYLNCDKNIITINKLLCLDKEFNIITEKIFDIEHINRRLMGIEDLKFYPTKNGLKFLGTGFHNNNSIGIVVGDYELSAPILKVNEITQDFKKTDCEKNWVFFNILLPDTNVILETFVIYNWFPLTICKLDENSKKLLPYVEKKMPKIFNYVRGSSCGFNYNNEIWFITHIVSYEQPRYYYNLIAVFNTNMDLLRYSAPFKLANTPIEYTLSIVVENNKVLIPYSKWDRETLIAIFDKEYIEATLNYYP
jgi:tetratricopeptide (TPR) repeat protein